MSGRVQFGEIIVPNGGIDESTSPLMLQANKWQSGLDAEPLPDGVRRRKGSEDINSLALAQIVESYTVGTASRNFVDGTSKFLAQGFQLSTGHTVKQIAVRLRIASGAPTGTLQCAIYSTTAGSPDAAIAGLGTADFNTFAAAALTTSFVWYFFRVTTGVALSGSTQYHIVISHAAAAAGNEFALEVDTSGSYANGQVHRSNAGSVWVAIGTEDANFKIYGAGAEINGMAFYELSDLAATYRLVVAGGELYVEESGVMRLLSGNYLTTPFTSGADKRVSIAIGADQAFITDGVNISKVFYRRAGVEYFENEGVSAPTANISAAAAAGGSLAAGAWEVDYYYWNDTLAIPSNSRYLGVGAATATLAAANLTLSITGIPAAIVRAGDRATHVRIAIKGPGYTAFRYSGVQVTLGTTTASVSSEALLGDPIEFDYDVPPIHTMKLIADNRQFIAGVSGFPSRLRFSKLSGIDAFYASYPALNYREFGRGDGDYLTALFFVRPRAVICGMKNSVWALDSRDPGISDRLEMARNIGIASFLSGTVVGERLYFVSDADQQKGMMLWNGNSVVPVLGIDKTFKALNQARLKYVSCGHMSPGDNRYQWWTLASFGGVSSQNRVLVYDYFIGAWTVYRLDGAILATIEDSSDQVSRVRIGRTDGVIRRTDSGSTDTGTGYTGQITLGDNYMGSPDALKKLRAIRYYAKSVASASANLAVLSDCGERAGASASLDYTGFSGGVLGTDVLGSLILGGSGLVCRRKRIRGLGRVFTATLSGSSAWHFQGLSYGVQPTGRD